MYQIIMVLQTEYGQSRYNRGIQQYVLWSVLTPNDSEEGLSLASGEILETLENWTERGSGWVIGRAELIHISIISYHPVRGGSYISLPATVCV